MCEPEDLLQNTFFHLLQNEFRRKYDQALLQRWTICIPCREALRGVDITEEFVDTHILKPVENTSDTFTTTDPNNSSFYRISDSTIFRINLSEKDDENVQRIDGRHSQHATARPTRILSVSRGYNVGYRSYHMYILDSSLTPRRSALVDSDDASRSAVTEIRTTDQATHISKIDPDFVHVWTKNVSLLTMVKSLPTGCESPLERFCADRSSGDSHPVGNDFTIVSKDTLFVQTCIKNRDPFLIYALPGLSYIKSMAISTTSKHSHKLFNHLSNRSYSASEFITRQDENYLTDLESELLTFIEDAKRCHEVNYLHDKLYKVIKKHWVKILNQMPLVVQRDSAFQKKLSTSLEIIVISRLHHVVFSSLCYHYAHEDEVIYVRCSQMAAQGASAYLFGASQDLATPLPAALASLATLDSYISPKEKLTCLRTTLDLVLAEIKGALADAKSANESRESKLRVISEIELIPLVSALLVQAKPLHSWSNLVYMERFQWTLLPSDGPSLNVYKSSLQQLLDLTPSDVRLKSSKSRTDITCPTLQDGNSKKLTNKNTRSGSDVKFYNNNDTVEQNMDISKIAPDKITSN